MKFQVTKFGLKHDPRGAQVTMQYQGRTLLGDVIGARYDEIRGVVLLKVKHFCGDMWPFEPTALSVDVLARR
jgi:hypothetical protein